MNIFPLSCSSSCVPTHQVERFPASWETCWSGVWVTWRASCWPEWPNLRRKRASCTTRQPLTASAPRTPSTHCWRGSPSWRKVRHSHWWIIQSVMSNETEFIFFFLLMWCHTSSNIFFSPAGPQYGIGRLVENLSRSMQVPCTALNSTWKNMQKAPPKGNKLIKKKAYLYTDSQWKYAFELRREKKSWQLFWYITEQKLSLIIAWQQTKSTENKKSKQ